MEDNFEKLNLLLEQELCEFVDIPDGFTGQTESGELRLIYLMNDAVESFLVLKNARMTGNYVRDYEGMKTLPNQTKPSLRILDIWILHFQSGCSAAFQHPPQTGIIQRPLKLNSDSLYN